MRDIQFLPRLFMLLETYSFAFLFRHGQKNCVRRIQTATGRKTERNWAIPTVNGRRTAWPNQLRDFLIRVTWDYPSTTESFPSRSLMDNWNESLSLSLCLSLSLSCSGLHYFNGLYPPFPASDFTVGIRDPCTWEVKISMIRMTPPPFHHHHQINSFFPGVCEPMDDPKCAGKNDFLQCDSTQSSCEMEGGKLVLMKAHSL